KGASSRSSGSLGWGSGPGPSGSFFQEPSFSYSIGSPGNPSMLSRLENVNSLSAEAWHRTQLLPKPELGYRNGKSSLSGACGVGGLVLPTLESKNAQYQPSTEPALSLTITVHCVGSGSTAPAYRAAGGGNISLMIIVPSGRSPWRPPISQAIISGEDHILTARWVP